MRTFTHNNKDDTILDRDGDRVLFTFIGNTFTMEEQDHMEFSVPQDDLFEMLGDYFDAGKHADIFDELTIPGQDALWDALFWMNERNIKL